MIGERFGKGTPRHGLLDEDIGPESPRWRSCLYPRNAPEKHKVDQVAEKDPVGGLRLPEQPHAGVGPEGNRCFRTQELQPFVHGICAGGGTTCGIIAHLRVTEPSADEVMPLRADSS
jgi:hypothetical protein